MSNPARIRHGAIVVLILVLIPASIACSKSTPAGTPASSAANAGGGGTAAVYVHALCTSMNDWVTSIKIRAAQVGPDVSSADTLVKRRALAVAYFGDLADLTGQLVDKVKAEGAPNVSGGEASHTVFVDAFTAAQQIFVAAQTTAKSLPVDKAKAFKTAFNNSLTALKSASDQIGTALSALSGGDLDTAAAADSACRTIGQ